MLKTKDMQRAANAIEEGKIVMMDLGERRVRINVLCKVEEPTEKLWSARWSHKHFVNARYDDVIDGQDEMLIYGMEEIEEAKEQ